MPPPTPKQTLKLTLDTTTNTITITLQDHHGHTIAPPQTLGPYPPEHFPTICNATTAHYKKSARTNNQKFVQLTTPI
ncbi:hypothetical protein CVU37_14885 [candidate division BRC1 bacterium HGW-BRC1-1]|jgi:hypothetical protein|nr:MAG: hypothetical protein CVU37_14885 [candidate division BRC1 bacterium HGW-BRC1-1]